MILVLDYLCHYHRIKSRLIISSRNIALKRNFTLIINYTDEQNQKSFQYNIIIPMKSGFTYLLVETYFSKYLIWLEIQNVFDAVRLQNYLTYLYIP